MQYTHTHTHTCKVAHLALGLIKSVFVGFHQLDSTLVELNGPCIFYIQIINLDACIQISPLLHSRTRNHSGGDRKK